MKVLSLFSGVGGFDMGLEAAGMTTAFQCEIDKHARAVLDRHWPTVPKWDDVTTLTGAYVLEKTGGVDIVAWGSPCQDLSVAGQRAGLAGAKSGLFHEGVRIIKELRELTNGKCPTWSLWENVPGALSSNGGADFGQVLYEMDEAGACFSEWAVLDAQYFGVPQRRRRVFVASCFDSGTAAGCSDPLFPVAESGGGDSAKGGAKGEAVAGASADSVGKDSESGVVSTVGYLQARDYKGIGNQYVAENKVVVQELTPEVFVKAKRAMSADDHDRWEQAGVSPTLNAFDVGDVRTVTAVVEAYPIQDGRGLDKNQNGFGVGDSTDPSYTLDATGGQSVAQVMAVVEPVLAFDTQFGSNANVFENQSPTLKASQQPPSALVEPLLIDGRRVDDVRVYEEPVQTLGARMGTGGNNVPMIASPWAAADNGNGVLSGSVTSKWHKGSGGPAGDEHYNLVVAESYDEYNDSLGGGVHHALRAGTKQSTGVLNTSELAVRRLTPLECERLMGWPDHHTSTGINGPISDSQRYKMCGNGVASPVAAWLGRVILNAGH